MHRWPSLAQIACVGIAIALLQGVAQAQAPDAEPEAARVNSVPSPDMDDKLLAIGLRLAKPLPTTAEGRDRQAAEFRDQLVDACRKPPRSSKYLSCIGLYILYDEESGEPRSTMIRPIVRIITETSPEFRPGSTNGSSSMIQSIPRGVLLKAQYVEAARMGKFAQVPIDSLFLNQRGKHRDGTSGWYYLAAFIGRDQNRREKLGIPDSLFSRSTYGG